MEKELQKIYVTYYNLLIAQDLWQAHYLLLSMILLKEFIGLSLLFQKGVYPDEYMDHWEKFNVTLFLEKKIFIVT